MTEPKVYKADIEEFIPDEKNANLGTQRGAFMLENSVRKLGAGRSLVVDKHGRIIAGNKTQEALVNAGFEEAIVIETDGKMPVIVKRTDYDLDEETGKAREYAYADNRVSEVDYLLDEARLLVDEMTGLDISDWYTVDELQEIRDRNNEEGKEDSGTQMNRRRIVCPECGYEWDSEI